MDVVLGVAGILCVALALGHETLGVVWVLPGLARESLPKTPFGSLTMTESMIRATWHLITVFVLAIATVLLTLAFAESADPETVMLRVFAGAWISAATTASVVALRRVRRPLDLFRLPVPALFVVVAVLLWTASI